MPTRRFVNLYAGFLIHAVSAKLFTIARFGAAEAHQITRPVCFFEGFEGYWAGEAGLLPFADWPGFGLLLL
jgi:hypothetical protein